MGRLPPASMRAALSAAATPRQAAPCPHSTAACTSGRDAGPVPAHGPWPTSRRHSGRCGGPAAARRRAQRPQRCNAEAGGLNGAAPAADTLTATDLQHLLRAVEVSHESMGQTQPHPYAGCVLANSEGLQVAEASQWAQGTEAPECQAARAAGGAARGGTAYLNLECGDCHGERAAVDALLAAGVARLVLGLRHPLPHLRSVAAGQLQAAGVRVLVLGEAPLGAGVSEEEGQLAADACLAANEALLHRAVLRRPLGLLKYAMTLDGKIATHTGHSAWVSSPQSRQQVFEMRARSDAVIVGGCTVRRDNPQLTTRRQGGHQPMRVVMSRTLDLPAEAKLWDVAHAPTIVATQRGARKDFQQVLRARGVEVLEFDFLTPDAVARYCYDRGFLQCLWECGGMLAAPAIATGSIHKAMAFVAPKLIGGSRAPTPVGDLGFVEMTQALTLAEVQWRQVGPDLMLTGYLPQSGGLRALAAAAAESDAPSSSSASSSSGAAAAGTSSAGGPTGGSSSSSSSGDGGDGGRAPRHPGSRLAPAGVAQFYKAWDRYGAFSNFSPHAISMPEGPMTSERAQQLHQQRAGGDGGPHRAWPSTEHYYQAQKFAGVGHEEAAALVEAIAAARSPEEAARLGRCAERQHAELVRADWAASKPAVMLAALRAKFATHAGPRQLLLATAGGKGSGPLDIVEGSPNDFFWGRGHDGSGQNMLGKLLGRVRQELLAGQPAGQAAPAQPAPQQRARGGASQQQQQQQQQQQPPLAAAQ